MAWGARLLPALFQAVYTLSIILIRLQEYTAAYTLMDSIMPQVLECEDGSFTANCFTCLADALVGLAGVKAATSRKEHLNRALDFINRAFAGTVLT